MIIVDKKEHNDYYPLICKDGQKYFYVDFDNNVPNCTIYDTNFIKNRKLTLTNLFKELKDLFEVYPYILKGFSINLKFKDKVEYMDYQNLLEFENAMNYINWDRKKILLKFLEQYLFLEPEVKTCNITLLKPLKYQEVWVPNIPFVSHNEMPRSKEIIYVNNVKRKIPKPRSLKKKDSLKFNGTTRQHILSRDKKCCQHCGVNVIDDPNVKGHADHIIPKSEGGPGEVWNGQLLCSKCNAEKHNNGNLDSDKDKLLELKNYYGIVGELKKVNGRWDYYDNEGNIVGRFNRTAIKKMG